MLMTFLRPSPKNDKRLFLTSGVRKLIPEINNAFYRLSRSVRVRTIDYKTTLHPGGSLRDKNWLELGDILTRKGVEVRDALLHF